MSSLPQKLLIGGGGGTQLLHVALVDGVTRSSEPFQSAETVLSLLCQDLNPCCTKYEVKCRSTKFQALEHFSSQSFKGLITMDEQLELPKEIFLAGRYVSQEKEE